MSDTTYALFIKYESTRDRTAWWQFDRVTTNETVRDNFVKQYSDIIAGRAAQPYVTRKVVNLNVHGLS